MICIQRICPNTAQDLMVLSTHWQALLSGWPTLSFYYLDVYSFVIYNESVNKLSIYLSIYLQNICLSMPLLNKGSWQFILRCIRDHNFYSGGTQYWHFIAICALEKFFHILQNIILENVFLILKIHILILILRIIFKGLTYQYMYYVCLFEINY